VLITKSQRIALLLAAAVVVATVVLPPWKYVGYPMTIVAGYSWIWAPIGHSPCQIQPTAEDLDWVRARPEHLPQFTRSFGCRPDQVNERPSDIAWHMMAIEWAAILLVAGLVVVSLHRRPRDHVSETAIQLGKLAEVAEAPSGDSRAPASSPLAAVISGVTRRLGVPLRTVIGKMAYLAAIIIGWSVTVGVTNKLLHTYVLPRLTNPHTCDNQCASSYGVLAGVVQLFIAIFFLVWMRHVRRSEGGRVAAAALGLVTIALALPLVVLIYV